MTLYQVEYPFEVDAERGTHSLVYLSLTAARKDAQLHYHARQQQEDEWGADNPSRQVTNPARVSGVKVGRATPELICTLINTGGEGWCTDEWPLGELRWDGKRVKYHAVDPPW